jgi:hypothetical protein
MIGSVNSAVRLMARTGRRMAPALAVGAVAAWMALAPQALAGSSAGGTGSPTGSSTKPNSSATLVGCESTGEQAERTATFAGEMSAIPGAAKMEMRIDVLERAIGETTFHTVSAAGLGVWRFAAPGVKNYRYLKEVTNLAAPAYYRGAVRFRWLNGKGKTIKSLELRTPRCWQPALPPEEQKTE